MVLAAGRGERMRPLTDTCPKPLQRVRGEPLIHWQLAALAAAGLTRVVINHAWLGEQIEAFVGDGGRYGLTVRWSREGEARGTAGGVIAALPLLRAPLLLVVSADLHSAYDYRHLVARAGELARGEPETLAHGVLVADPAYPRDFSLEGNRMVPPGQVAGTYGNMGVYRRAFFEHAAPGARELGPLLRAAVARRAVTGEWYGGPWANVGTVADLERVNAAGAGS